MSGARSNKGYHFTRQNVLTAPSMASPKYGPGRSPELAGIWLSASRGTAFATQYVRDFRPHAPDKAVVRVSGAATSKVRLVGANDAQVDRHTVLVDGDVQATALEVETR